MPGLRQRRRARLGCRNQSSAAGRAARIRAPSGAGVLGSIDLSGLTRINDSDPASRAQWARAAGEGAARTGEAAMKAKGRSKPPKRPAAVRPARGQPLDVPVVIMEYEPDDTPDQPFAPGIADELDPDLRHR